MVYCEICGRKIKTPNFIADSFKGMHESFYECALCTLELHIDQYNEFKDEIPSIDFHISQLTLINTLIRELQSNMFIK